MALFGLQRYRDAIEEFSKELAEEPESARALASRGAALANIKKYREAEQDIQRSIAIAPDFAHPFYVLSVINQSRRKLDAAESAIRRALELGTDVEYYCQLANILHAMHRHQEALDAATTALQINSNSVPAMLAKARALIALHQIAEAGSLLHSALQENPDDSSAYEALGAFHLRRADLSKANQFLQEGLRLNPQAPASRFMITSAYGRLIPPFRTFDALVPRWYWWAPIKRWSLVAAVATAMILLILQPSPFGPGANLTVVFYVLAVNFLLFPVSYDCCAAYYAERCSAKSAGIRHIDLNVLVPVIVLFLNHVMFTVLVWLVAWHPYQAFLALGALMNMDFLLGLRRKDKLGLGKWFIPWELVLLTALGVGTLSVEKQPRLALLSWIVVVAASAVAAYSCRRLPPSTAPSILD